MSKKWLNSVQIDLAELANCNWTWQKYSTVVMELIIFSNNPNIWPIVHCTLKGDRQLERWIGGDDMDGPIFHLPTDYTMLDLFLIQKRLIYAINRYKSSPN